MKRNAKLTLNTLFLALLLITITGCEDTTPTSPTTPDTKEYTITFDAAGGTLAGPATVNVEIGKTVAKPQNPTRAGFSFTAWQKADGTAFNFTTEIMTADITLTANWSANAGTTTYTVTFDPNGGMLAGNATMEIAKNETLAQPQNPTRAGFSFARWQKADGTAFDFATETISTNITLTATWNANAGTVTHTVTFDPNGGTLAGNATVDVAENQPVAQPQNPTLPEFSFVEWQQANGTAFDFTTEAVTANITLTATWRSAGTVTAVALTANEMDDGYTVNYTYTNADGTGTGGTPEVTWFISDNPDGSNSTQVAMGMEVTHIPMGVNRYKHLAASVRVMSAEGAYTAAVISATVFPGFSKHTTGTAAERFTPGRIAHTSVVFNDRMWVIAGFGSTNNYLNDVWSSTDGITWRQATANAGFTARISHTSVVFDNRMWVIGGFNEGSLDDVWSSVNGIAWTQETDNAAFLGRQRHTSVVFQDSIRVIGGFDAQFTRLNDVWSSADGETWIETTADAGFPIRDSHTSMVFDGRMWVVGGSEGNLLNDVWSSTDGSNWTAVRTNGAPNGFTARNSHVTVVFDDKMWVIAGISDRFFSVNDVWSSADGSTWTEVTDDAGFRNRSAHTAVAFDGKIWIIGGDVNRVLNDVWY